MRQCFHCGRFFKNAQGVRAHLQFCPSYRAKVVGAENGSPPSEMIKLNPTFDATPDKLKSYHCAKCHRSFESRVLLLGNELEDRCCKGFVLVYDGIRPAHLDGATVV